MTAAMLLGAGYGTRLRPLTEFQPKPLVPIGNRPLLAWHLDALDALGIQSVALNVSHLTEQVESYVAERKEGLPRVELIREDTPLGSGGGLLGAHRFLASESCFLVINADIFHAIDLENVLEAHDRTKADATLVVRRAGPKEPHDDIAIDRDGSVTGGSEREGATTGWRFVGIHALTPAVFEHLSTPGSLLAGYEGLLANGAKIMSYDCGKSTWFDIGTPANYLKASYAAIAAGPQSPPSLDGVEVIEPVLVHQSAEIAAGCSIGPLTAIGKGVSIGSGSQLSRSVAWPEVSVPPDSVLRGCIAHPGGILAVDNPA